jgi:hypothetical protein
VKALVHDQAPWLVHLEPRFKVKPPNAAARPARSIDPKAPRFVHPEWCYWARDIARTLKALEGALTTLAATGPKARMIAARELDALRRGATALPENPSLRKAAAQVIKDVTGTDRYSLFDKWLEEERQAASSA